MKQRRSTLYCFLVLAHLSGALMVHAAEANTSVVFFEGTIRPVVKEFCLGCHSAEKHKGDLDLERFSSLTEVKKHPKVWQQVIEQLSLGEMPPKEKPQPTAAQREQLVAWVNAVLDEVALARAGDPGPVVLRRLSNAEYTYTIRDLTGVESLDPAREFPVDGAAGEGFMNVGNALVMSPSLITKYLDAGKEIASHAILLPDGIRFSVKDTRRDWTEEILGEIRRFYGRYTVQGGGSAVNLQGIKFDTKDGGVAPLERYITVLLKERNGQAPDSLRSGLSEKYLKLLRETLEPETSLSLTPTLSPRRGRSARPIRVCPLGNVARRQSSWIRFGRGIVLQTPMRRRGLCGKSRDGSGRCGSSIVWGTSARSAGRRNGWKRSVQWIFNRKCG
jgi:hypothetical protein